MKVRLLSKQFSIDKRRPKLAGQHKCKDNEDQLDKLVRPQYRGRRTDLKKTNQTDTNNTFKKMKGSDVGQGKICRQDFPEYNDSQKSCEELQLSYTGEKKYARNVDQKPDTPNPASPQKPQLQKLKPPGSAVWEKINQELQLIGLQAKRAQSNQSFFAAIADQLWGEEEQFQHVFYMIYECIRQRYREIQPSFSISEIHAYLEKLRGPEDINIGVIEMMAASIAFRVNICIYRYKKSPFLLQNYPKNNYVLNLSFHGYNKFGSIRKLNGFWPVQKITQELIYLYANLYEKQFEQDEIIQKQHIQQQKIFKKRENTRTTKKGIKEEGQQYIGIESLNHTLKKLGVRQKLILADGNCFFRALADQLQGAEAHHQFFRRKIMDYVEQNQNQFGPFIVNCTFKAYVKRKKKDGVWGGLIELQAASELFKVNICIFEEGKPARVLSNFDDTGSNTIYVSYNGAHYNSIRRLDDYGHGRVKPIKLNLLDQSQSRRDVQQKHEDDLEKIRAALQQTRNINQLQENDQMETEISEDDKQKDTSDENQTENNTLDNSQTDLGSSADYKGDTESQDDLQEKQKKNNVQQNSSKTRNSWINSQQNSKLEKKTREDKVLRYLCFNIIVQVYFLFVLQFLQDIKISSVQYLFFVYQQILSNDEFLLANVFVLRHLPKNKFQVQSTGDDQRNNNQILQQNEDMRIQEIKQYMVEL
eukprot:TRINITY_DN17491_c0_g1_i4.p1 TRINITY_DN17491_c0_g1~~TRINITY_DN17491_c0_g1_i4.p1  ORF type:complete len:701 (-),score=66.13 TRINITY_DN17491_c0_g1_i4:264-2366(-)